MECYSDLGTDCCRVNIGAVDIDRKILLSPRDIAKFNISPGQYRTAVRRSPRLAVGRGRISLAESAICVGKVYESTYNFDSPLRDKPNIKVSQTDTVSGFSGRRRGLVRVGRFHNLRRCADGRLTTASGLGAAVVKGCSVCKVREVVECSCISEEH